VGFLCVKAVVLIVKRDMYIICLLRKKDPINKYSRESENVKLYIPIKAKAHFKCEREGVWVFVPLGSFSYVIVQNRATTYKSRKREKISI